MIRAVIFDLDDTLILEREYVESGYRYISKLLSNRFGKNEHEIYGVLIRLLNDNSKNVFNNALDILGIPYGDETIHDLVQEYRNHPPTIKFLSDVLPCVETLKKNAIKVGLLTDGYSHSQRRKLKALKADDYFDEMIVTDELGRAYWKPHPRAFEIMKEQLDVNFNEMAYVGDNPEKDFYIGSIYPIHTIRIYRSGFYRSGTYLNGIREKHSIDCLSELILLAEQIGLNLS